MSFVRFGLIVTPSYRYVFILLEPLLFDIFLHFFLVAVILLLGVRQGVLLVHRLV